ncbi:two-component regulator propeller domain-containing protein [candidate division KSB1 bacterium]
MLKNLKTKCFVFILSVFVLNNVYGQDEWINYTTADGLVNDYVSSIAIYSDTLLFGTRGGGVSKFFDTTWDSLNTDSGLVNNFLNTIAVDKDTIWFGTDSSVSKFYGSTWDTLGTIDGLISDTVLSIAISKDTVWFGTDSGVSKFYGMTWDTLNIDSGLVSNRVNAIAIYADTVWFGTDSGVNIFAGAAWDTLDTSNGLAYLNVNAIAIDSSNYKWFATDSGVYKYGEAIWDTLTFVDGLVNDIVNTIAVDTAGNKWFGTDGGVSKYNGVSFTNYTTTNGLINDFVYSIAFDTVGNIWFGTQGGVSRLGTPLYGDVDFSNTVVTTDASKVLEYRVEKTSFDANQIRRADVSGIGGVTSFDASLILQWVASIIFQFPIEMPKTSIIGDNRNAEIVISKESGSSNVIVYKIEASKIYDVLSADLEVNYDFRSLKYIGYELSEFMKDFIVETDKKDDGILSVAMAGIEGISESAELIFLKFEKMDDVVEDIRLVSALLNESDVEAISNVNKNLPNKFELYQNYPNPFNPKTKIDYQILKESKVVLKIYNILGQEVKTLINETKPAGSYSIIWDSRNDSGIELPSGIYFYRIIAGDFVRTMKLVIIR